MLYTSLNNTNADTCCTPSHVNATRSIQNVTRFTSNVTSLSLAEEETTDMLHCQDRTTSTSREMYVKMLHIANLCHI